jgi:hypothetical protein
VAGPFFFSEMRFLNALVIVLWGCSTVESVTPSAEVHQRCAGQMYFQRATQGRSPPNWNLYEYCVRQAMSR